MNKTESFPCGTYIQVERLDNEQVEWRVSHNTNKDLVYLRAYGSVTVSWLET